MVTISEIIKAFESSYNSFEICSVVHNDGSVWNNVLTTIYVSKNIVEKPEESILYDGTHIKILKIKINYSDLIPSLEGLKKGQLYFGGLKAQIASPFDYDNLKIDEDRYANYRQTEGARTFYCQRNFNVFSSDSLLIKHLDQINADVIKLGFIDSFDFISYHTGLRGLRSYSANHSSDFLMIIPVFFSINTAIVENEVLIVDLVYDEVFNDLQINVMRARARAVAEMQLRQQSSKSCF